MMKVFKIFCAAFLAVCVPLMAHVIAERYFPADLPAARVASPAASSTSAEAQPASQASAEAPTPTEAQIATADPLAAGAKVAKKCTACHTFEAGAANKVGPNLFGIVGAAVASKEGFAYSDDLKAVGGVWSVDHLEAWLTNPKALAPKTKMAFAGISSEQERKDLLIYLESLK